MARFGRQFPIKAHVGQTLFRDVLFPPPLPVGRSFIVSEVAVTRAATARYRRSEGFQPHVTQNALPIIFNPPVVVVDSSPPGWARMPRRKGRHRDLFWN